MTIQNKLKESFRCYGDCVAIRQGDQEITYKILWEAAIKIARALLDARVPIQVPVGIMMSNRINMIYSVVGVLMMRGIIMPIDNTYPASYIERMTQTVPCTILLTDRGARQGSEYFRQKKDSNITCLDIESIIESNLPEAWSPALEEDISLDAIYAYFTSGTQGNPHAVIGKNESLVHYLLWEMNEFGLPPHVRVSQFTSPSHDPFLRDVFIPLLSGGMICIPESNKFQSKSDVVQWINHNRIQLIHCTPSFFRSLKPPISQFEDFPDLQYVLLAGEKLLSADLIKWYEEFGDRIKLVNLYGPTETTLAKIFHLIRPEVDLKSPVIPIGKPISSTDAVILDESFQLCDTNEKGEIVIRTPYSTYGYYGDPELQKQRFVINPITQDPNDILYKTGDYGYVNLEGDIIFAGRMDKQFKYRGYRIESALIEQTALEIPGLEQCVVTFKPAQELDLSEYLILYYVSSVSMTNDFIKAYLGEKLPPYMIPTYVVQLDEIPMTVNQKIDYQALPMPEEVHQKPMTPLEKKLAMMWENILEIKPVGISDNFFSLGGHSLLLLRMEGELMDMGIEVEPNELYQYQTIQELARFIESKQSQRGMCSDSTGTIQ